MPTHKTANSEGPRSGFQRRTLVFLVGALLIVFALAVTKRTARVNEAIPSPEQSALTAKRTESFPPLAAPQTAALRIEENTETRIRALWSFASPEERLELMRLLQEYGNNGESALSLLEEFLRHPDQDVRRAAMRGLAATQSPKAISELQKYLSDSVAIEESTEAALALATMQDSRVTPILQGALENARDATLREHIVDALVSRPQAEVEPFIDAFLQRTDVGLAEKQNLLRMTGLNSTKSAEFLGSFLSNHNEELRHGAYQGLALVTNARLTRLLLPKVEAETDPSDRALVYEALGNQLDAKISSLGALADAEADDYAKLRALKAWTEAAGREGVSLYTDPASPARIAALQDAAINHPDFAERRVALFALGFARQDAAARAALEAVAQKSSSEKIRALAQGLLANPN